MCDQDHALPACPDKRYPGDTLFIVMEEDFRFWPDGQYPQGMDDYTLLVQDTIHKNGFQTDRVGQRL